MKKPFKTKRVICIKCKRRFPVPIDKNPPYYCGRCLDEMNKQEVK